MFLVYGGDIKWELRVTCYTDARYLTDADDSKSYTGYVFFLNGGAVDFKSAKQSIIATSSTEAEYMTASEAVWIRKFIFGLSVVPTNEEPMKMYCDNTRANSIANEQGITKGAKHYHTKVHYLCEVIELGDIKFDKVHTNENVADAVLPSPYVVFRNQFIDQLADRMNDMMNSRRHGDRNGRRSEGEESENSFFEGDGSSSDEQPDRPTTLKGVFGGKEDNIEDVVVVANDLCSSMIQTTLSVNFSKILDSNPHELIWLIKGNLVEVSILIGQKYQEGYLKAKPMVDKFAFKTIKVRGRVIIKKGFDAGNTNLDATSTRDE
ncbi:hypothetical protein Tco_0820330 [Tanacetum coccineum]|uniref:Uncharacterized protein n=1 Tax=Tanacetum coccineum TaxID=301880 RepID=A0ABQ5ADF3_9ASTR